MPKIINNDLSFKHFAWRGIISLVSSLIVVCRIPLPFPQRPTKDSLYNSKCYFCHLYLSNITFIFAFVSFVFVSVVSDWRQARIFFIGRLGCKMIFQWKSSPLHPSFCPLHISTQLDQVYFSQNILPLLWKFCFPARCIWGDMLYPSIHFSELKFACCSAHQGNCFHRLRLWVDSTWLWEKYRAMNEVFVLHLAIVIVLDFHIGILLDFVIVIALDFE